MDDNLSQLLYEYLFEKFEEYQIKLPDNHQLRNILLELVWSSHYSFFICFNWYRDIKSIDDKYLAFFREIISNKDILEDALS